MSCFLYHLCPVKKNNSLNIKVSISGWTLSGCTIHKIPGKKKTTVEGLILRAWQSMQEHFVPRAIDDQLGQHLYTSTKMCSVFFFFTQACFRWVSSLVQQFKKVWWRNFWLLHNWYNVRLGHFPPANRQKACCVLLNIFLPLDPITHQLHL